MAGFNGGALKGHILGFYANAYGVVEEISRAHKDEKLRYAYGMFIAGKKDEKEILEIMGVILSGRIL